MVAPCENVLKFELSLPHLQIVQVCRLIKHGHDVESAYAPRIPCTVYRPPAVPLGAHKDVSKYDKDECAVLQRGHRHPRRSTQQWWGLHRVGRRRRAVFNLLLDDGFSCPCATSPCGYARATHDICELCCQFRKMGFVPPCAFHATGASDRVGRLGIQMKMKRRKRRTESEGSVKAREQTRRVVVCESGRYVDSLAYARETEAAGNISTTPFLQILVERARCQIYALTPRFATTTATEGVLLGQTVLRDLEGTGDTTSERQTIMYATFLNLADGYADSGNMDEALRRLSNAKDALSKQELASAEEVGSDVHSCHVISIKRARIMFAKGEYAAAASLVEDVVDIERERAKVRKSLVSSWTKILQYSGIVYCKVGRHEDGSRAAAEVLQLKKSLATSPGLARLVEVEEMLMTSRELWNSVRTEQDKLKCHHQESTIREKAESRGFNYLIIIYVNNVNNQDCFLKFTETHATTYRLHTGGERSTVNETFCPLTLLYL